jgi:uncharacterized protein
MMRPTFRVQTSAWSSTCPFSVYDVTVPVMVHGLNVMGNYLNHAQAFERTRGIEPGRILRKRLASDMLTFGEQFSVSCNKVNAHMAKARRRHLALI